MFTRLVRGQLVAFVALSAVVISAVAVNYLDLPHLLGFGQYRITAEFARADGLYPSAEVTYRGVPVGRVRAVRLTAGEKAAVELAINDDVLIPRTVTAQATSMSAIGEQAVDLASEQRGGPYLAPGEVIPSTRTTGLPSAAEVLNRTHALLASLPKGPRTIQLLDDVSTAFARGSTDLRPLLASTEQLLDEARANETATIGLIHNLGPFLTTQILIAPRLRSSANDLAPFTHRLWMADPALRGILSSGPPALGAADDLLDGLRTDLPPLLTSLDAVAGVTRVYRPGLRQILVIYPALTAMLQSTLVGHPAEPGLKAALRVDAGTPPVCFPGFLPLTQQRPPAVATTRVVPQNLYCRAPPSDARSYRGSRNIPCLNAPGRRAASVEECLGRPIDSLRRFATAPHAVTGHH